MSVPYSQSPMTMATNFFQQQDSARRKTFELVVYFVLAILILIALVYGLLLALSTYAVSYTHLTLPTKRIV